MTWFIFIGDMLVITIRGIQDGSDTALCPIAGAVTQRALGNERNFAGLGQMKGD